MHFHPIATLFHSITQGIAPLQHSFRPDTPGSGKPGNGNPDDDQIGENRRPSLHGPGIWLLPSRDNDPPVTMELVNELLNDPESYRTAGTTMQTKITIEVDNDVLDSARQIAESRGMSIDEFINDLIKQRRQVSKPPPVYERGVRLLPIQPGGRMTTLEETLALIDESE
jgi:hypothetical protein